MPPRGFRYGLCVIHVTFARVACRPAGNVIRITQETSSVLSGDHSAFGDRKLWPGQEKPMGSLCGSSWRVSTGLGPFHSQPEAVTDREDRRVELRVRDELRVERAYRLGVRNAVVDARAGGASTPEQIVHGDGPARTQ